MSPLDSTAMPSGESNRGGPPGLVFLETRERMPVSGSTRITPPDPPKMNGSATTSDQSLVPSQPAGGVDSIATPRGSLKTGLPPGFPFSETTMRSPFALSTLNSVPVPPSDA